LDISAHRNTKANIKNIQKGKWNMSKDIKKILHEGKMHYSVPDAARYLGITAAKIRQLLGAGDMVAVTHNRKLLVMGESLVAYKYRPKETTAPPRAKLMNADADLHQFHANNIFAVPA
ncbi:MAG: helix-turn-helix domain-containing protein, partial [Alphaproteobacteria bacterium]